MPEVSQRSRTQASAWPPTLCLLCHRGTLGPIWMLICYWELKPAKVSRQHPPPRKLVRYEQSSHTPPSAVPALWCLRNRQMGGPYEGPLASVGGESWIQGLPTPHQELFGNSSRPWVTGGRLCLETGTEMHSGATHTQPLADTWSPALLSTCGSQPPRLGAQQPLVPSRGDAGGWLCPSASWELQVQSPGSPP